MIFVSLTTVCIIIIIIRTIIVIVILYETAVTLSECNIDDG